MRLEPLYTVTFTTPEAWSVEVAADAGIEGRGFLLAEGRSTGRLSARYRAANFPRKRSDGAVVPEFRGVLETDDGAVILFEWQGLSVLSETLACDSCSAASCIRPTIPATGGLTIASARSRARSARVPTDLDSTLCWKSRRWSGKGWHEEERLPYLPAYRASRLLASRGSGLHRCPSGWRSPKCLEASS